jgi:DNA-binding transcriptional LysR family regulator
MELRHLRYFQALAEELHFGRAADRVHVVRPYFSRQIAALEAELGAQLFTRTTRGVALTPAGEALRERAERILPAIGEAIEATRATALGGLGRLELGYISVAMLSIIPPILAEHRRRHPDVLFRMRELPVAGEDLSGLLDGTLDAAFVSPVTQLRGLEYRTVLREPYMAVLPADHPQASKPEVDLADLADERFVLMPREQNPVSYELFDELCRAAGFNPNIHDEGDTPNVLHLVGLGFGVSISPASGERGNYPGVVFRPFSHPNRPVELVIAFRKSDRSSMLAAFLSTVDDVVARLGSDIVQTSGPDFVPADMEADIDRV